MKAERTRNFFAKLMGRYLGYNKAEKEYGLCKLELNELERLAEVGKAVELALSMYKSMSRSGNKLLVHEGKCVVDLLEWYREVNSGL